MTLRLPILAVVMLGGFGGCVDGMRPGERTVVAYPGMPVAEFNRLNDQSATALDADDSDWIGVNSPVKLVVRYNGHEAIVRGWRRGGGTQVASRVLDDEGRLGPARVTAIAFSIGGGMESIEEMLPTIIEQCEILAGMAGVPAIRPPETEALRQALDGDIGPVRDAALCSGEGESMTFSIAASHPTTHHRRGGDFGWAFFDGYIGETIDVSSIDGG